MNTLMNILYTAQMIYGIVFYLVFGIVLIILILQLIKGVKCYIKKTQLQITLLEQGEAEKEKS